MRKGIDIHRRVYFSPAVRKPERCILKMNRGRFLKKWYLVGFCNESERLEIFLSYNFYQKAFRNQQYAAVGLFASLDDAFEYIRVISDISFEKYNSFNLYKTINELDFSDLDRIASELEGKEDKE